MQRPACRPPSNSPSGCGTTAARSTATLSAQLRKRGFDDMSIDGLRPTRPDAKVVGRARTLRFIAFRDDLSAARGGGGYNAQKRAFDSLRPGDVLVIEARGERGTGTVGDILALRAQTLGAAGIVTDGGVRDYATVASLGIPTYSQGPHPAVLGRRHVPWDVNVTVTCGGAAVQPGDVIVGDVRRSDRHTPRAGRGARRRRDRAGARGGIHR